MLGEKPNYNEVKNELPHLPQVYTGTDAIYEEESVNMKDFVIGALVGGIVGAAAGMLLAPKTGRDLRSDVAIQAGNLKDKSVHLSSTAKDKTVQLSNQLKEQSTQLVDKVKAKSSKVPTIYDDGTVSYEDDDLLENETYEGVDMSEASKPSSI
ncbi:YtxH domain-containing protein [Lysinibacillus yapensis]|uniref:YtxH domain-containing protein n=1 Tax=Ureibacillus yapensis TaxID=2304605 RepID=A0A396S440_9BACL|nr:YtxH domain-containing protein [Lysinibacillus yapensis]RHW33236.1 YtxH domain-containing protein [Lysinibacillus yapensis]